MTTFREVMSIIHADSIVLSHTAVNGTSYICNGWTSKDFQRLVEDFGDAEVMRVDFHTSYGNRPEIFLSARYRSKRDSLRHWSWDDLTSEQKEQATEEYLCIREAEEDRGRNETNKDYPDPIDPEGVKNCSFRIQADGYVMVLI